MTCATESVIESVILLNIEDNPVPEFANENPPKQPKNRIKEAGGAVECMKGNL
jgi:hypothetical protein